LRPEAASEHPEELVEGPECGLAMLALEDRQLLAERQILKE